MKMKNLKVGTKIGLGFGVVLVLLGLLAGWSFFGIGSIVGDADTVISGNQLDSALAQREVDHLVWARQLTELLNNDEISTLTVETDHRKCAFGKWLYGEGRKAAEKQVPTLEPLLKKIETPHQQLHESAMAIGDIYHEVDHRLGWFLREKKSDHLNWMHRIKDVLMDPAAKEMNVQTDPRKSNLGKWLYSTETQKMKTEDSNFGQLVEVLEPLHRELHASVAEIGSLLEQGSRAEATAYFREHTVAYAQQTIAALDDVRDWHDGLIEIQEDAQAIYAYETMPALLEVQELLQQIRREARGSIMSDQAMLNAAKTTRGSIVVISAAALLLGMVLAFFISRGIIRSLKSGAAEMEEGAAQVESASDQISSASQSLA